MEKDKVEVVCIQSKELPNIADFMCVKELTDIRVKSALEKLGVKNGNQG